MSRVIDILEAQRRAAAEEQETLRSKLREVSALLKELDESIAKLSDDPEVVARMERRSGKVTLNDMIIQILPAWSEGATAQDIADKLTEDGRETSNTSVSSAMSRLKKEGQVEKRDGRWFLIEKEPPEGGSDDEGEAGAEAATSTGSTPVSPISLRSGRDRFLAGTSLSSISSTPNKPVIDQEGG